MKDEKCHMAAPTGGSDLKLSARLKGAGRLYKYVTRKLDKSTS